MANLDNLVEEIKKLTLVEVNELVKKIETEFGVSAAAQLAAGATAGVAEAAAEQSEFTVILKEVGDKKLEVIKAVREITGLGLGDSKAMVDNAPSTIKENIPTDEAKEIAAKLQQAGATVELK